MLVCVRRQAVQCLNASLLYRLKLHESLLEPTFFVFNRLYSFGYKMNDQRNYHVVVLQESLREEFMQRYVARNDVVVDAGDPTWGILITEAK